MVAAMPAKYSRQSAPDRMSTAIVSWIGLPVSRGSISARTPFLSRRVSAVRFRERPRPAAGRAAVEGARQRSAQPDAVDHGGDRFGHVQGVFARGQRLQGMGDIAGDAALIGALDAGKARRVWHQSPEGQPDGGDTPLELDI